MRTVALTSNQVREAMFPTVRLAAGYDMMEVDALLDRLVAALETYERGSAAVDLSSSELERADFTQTRLREGYDMRDVDALISDAVQTLRDYEQSPPRPASSPSQSPTTAWGLSVKDLIRRLEDLQATHGDGTERTPVRAQTPDGNTYAVAAVISSPDGPVIALSP